METSVDWTRGSCVPVAIRIFESEEMRVLSRMVAVVACGILLYGAADAQVRYPLSYPPKLPQGRKYLRGSSREFLKPGPNLRKGVLIAKTPPVVEFLYYPGQNYPGNPWSFRGVGCVRQGKYYSALCDHRAPLGTAMLFEYDVAKRAFRLLCNTAKFLRKAGQITERMKYTPGEVQTRIEFGSDGKLYYGTTRGSTRVTNDAHGFQGEWVLRTDPETRKTEVVSAFPVAKHCILASVLDPKRMIFYGGTAAGDYRVKDVRFFAVDVKTGKVIKTARDGFDRYAIFSRSTGCVYWNGRKYDPRTQKISRSEAPHVRSATAETKSGVVYGTSHRKARLWAFNTRTEKLAWLGEGAVASQEYVAAINVDPTGRYLYYIPGAHGGATKDGTPIVQYDLRTKRRKVLAFLHSYFKRACGYHLDGCFCCVLDEKGEKLFVSWDGWRTGQPRGMESAALTVIHIPASERRP